MIIIISGSIIIIIIIIIINPYCSDQGQPTFYACLGPNLCSVVSSGRGGENEGATKRAGDEFTQRGIVPGISWVVYWQLPEAFW